MCLSRCGALLLKPLINQQVFADTEIVERALKNHYLSNEKILMCKRILIFISSQFYVLYLVFEQK